MLDALDKLHNKWDEEDRDIGYDDPDDNKPNPNILSALKSIRPATNHIATLILFIEAFTLLNV